MSKPCCPISFCGRGPPDVICEAPPVKVRNMVTNWYHPCPASCKCPDIWPMLVPKVKCCLRPPPRQGPPDCPVMPKCQSLRGCPIKCPVKRPMSPQRIQPPVLPCFSPCCMPNIPPQPKPPYIRCLKPCIPCCPPVPCPPIPVYPPEPPYPKYCPVFAPCTCPDRPIIVHNSVRTFRITADCKRLLAREDPKVCFVPISGVELGQWNYHMGTCYNTC